MSITLIDLVLIFLWFIVGLFVFQIKGIKGTSEEISGLLSVIPFLVGLLYTIQIQKPEMIIGYVVENVGAEIIGIIKGFLYSLAYLIGANISRFAQFGTMSYRIITYLTLFIFIFYLLGSI